MPHRGFRSVVIVVTALAALALAAGAVQNPPASPAGRAQGAPTPAATPTALPNREGSFKFYVLGDFGNGGREQRELAAQMIALRARFAAQLVITVGDNIYGGESQNDFKRKFEEPYRGLLDAGVKFYASLGNHDGREQARYTLFNMGGKTFYSFKAPRQDVKLIAVESDYPTPKQMTWLQDELGGGEDWMIPYFHHPPYSSGKRHGSHTDLRNVLEPMFLKSNVTVVFTGHDHFYERTKPQQGITYFVVGSGGQLRRNGIDRKSGLTAMGFDTDRAFLAVEIDKDELYFNAISRTGAIVDSGLIERRRRDQ
jgi:calcineurin-like phosphoesterase family protein